MKAGTISKPGSGVFSYLEYYHSLCAAKMGYWMTLVLLLSFTFSQISVFLNFFLEFIYRMQKFKKTKTKTKKKPTYHSCLHQHPQLGHHQLDYCCYVNWSLQMTATKEFIHAEAMIEGFASHLYKN